MIPNVKRLGLVYTGNQEYGLHRLKDLHQLENLKIFGHHQFCWQGKNPSFPKTLKKLSLVGGAFPWEDMGIVASLPNLEVLKLLNNACRGETWEVKDEFPKLMSLVIDTSSLRRWIAHTNSFPQLKFLVLRYCWNLSEIPEDIGDIPNLELFEVDQCSMSLVISAKQIEEDQETYQNDILQIRIVGEFTDEQAIDKSSSAFSSSEVATTSQKDVGVSLDRDLIDIKRRFCAGSSRLRVLPILGMGGIGKTTLALNAYDDPLIVDHFSIRAWVTVSQDYSEKKILLSLLLKLFRTELAIKEKIDNYAALVYKTLKHRRYLIVLDDVWSTKVWDDLRKSFPDDGNGSRIVLTSRLSDVAAYPDSHSPLHEMRFMDDYQSWILLHQKVGSFPSEVEDAGKEIARRCSGLPLAVVQVAGVLSAVSKSKAAWEEIAKDVTPAVEQELYAILSSSYMHLHHHLRPCLLTFGGLPGDRIIRVSRLIKLRIAEGFLKHRDGCSLEEEAAEYLEDLVKSNLVIVNSRKYDRKIKSCSVHDMVHGLCTSKAHDEKSLGVVDEHVLPQGLMNDRCISLSGEVDIAFWDRSRLLRVLNFVVHDNRTELPAQVFELFHLRYLALFNYMSVIPSDISILVNLQTLIIHPSTYGSVKMKWTRVRSRFDYSLPLGTWRMGQLRHLLTYVPHTLPPPPDPNEAELLPLENLQTLLPVQNLAWDEKVLVMIPNVKRLGLVYTGNQEYGLHHLKDLHQLENLKILGYHHFCWQGQNPHFPRTLKKMTLAGGRFPWEGMGIVGSLPNLQVLKLLDNACHGEAWEVRNHEFPQLMTLLIDTSDPKRWIAHTNSFPQLKYLVLHYCWDLSEIPEDIGDIPTLELIEVHYCSMSLVMSAKKIKEDQESYGNDYLQLRFDDFAGSRWSWLQL